MDKCNEEVTIWGRHNDEEMFIKLRCGLPEGHEGDHKCKQQVLITQDTTFQQYNDITIEWEQKAEVRLERMRET